MSAVVTTTTWEILKYKCKAQGPTRLNNVSLSRAFALKCFLPGRWMIVMSYRLSSSSHQPICLSWWRKLNNHIKLMVCAHCTFPAEASELMGKPDDREQLLTSSTVSTLCCGQYGTCIPNSLLAPILNLRYFPANGEVRGDSITNKVPLLGRNG